MSYKDLIDAVFGDKDTSENYTFSEQVFIDDVISTLTDREALVLYKRFAFNGFDFRTLKALGLEFGVTGNRIRQIENKALRKLRHPSRSKCIHQNRRAAEIQEENRKIAAQNAETEQTEKQKIYQQYKISIDEFHISCRTRNCLMSSDIIYISNLLSWTENELLRLPNFGRKSLNEIKDILANLGLQLAK